MQHEIEKISEKCNENPTKEMCKDCISKKVDDCWMRIISKLTGCRPWPHSGFEVADTVLYDEFKGTYFIIKAKEISKMVGEGDKLYRQCTQLFDKSYALVLYWNAFDTHPIVIEAIRKIAENATTDPRFVEVKKKYIRQVYRHYIEIEQQNNEDETKSLD